MASGGQIAEYFATLGFKINQQDIKKFDKALDRLEKRAYKFAKDSLSNVRLEISKFGFSSDFNTRLHRALRQRMKVASGKGVSPEIKLDKFDVDQQQLLRDTRNAIRFVENNIRMRVNTSVDSAGMMGNFAGGRAASAMRGAAVGSMAGAAGRGLFPGLGGVWAVSQLNAQQQQLRAQEMSAQAVFGGREEGQRQVEWVRRLGYDIGFDYSSLMPAYTKMQAALSNSEIGAEGGKRIFKAMTEYSRVMGLSNPDMKGSLRAIEQMFNKGKITAEELKSQLGERLPAAIPLMAEAVTGGNSDKLFEMMEAGELRPEIHLPLFAELLSEKARKGGALSEAKMSSMASQGRMQSAWADTVKLLGESGFERGQANIFDRVGDSLRRSTTLVKAFGEAWKSIIFILETPLGLLGDLSVILGKISENLEVSEGSLLGFSALLAGLKFTTTRLLLAFTGIMLVLEDITAFITGRGSAIGSFLNMLGEGKAKEVREGLGGVAKELLGLFKAIAELLKVIVSQFDTMENDYDFKVLKNLLNLIESATSGLKGLIQLMSGKDIMDLDVTQPFFMKGESKKEKQKAWARGEQDSGILGGMFSFDTGILGHLSNLAGVGGDGPQKDAVRERVRSVITGLRRMDSGVLESESFGKSPYSMKNMKDRILEKEEALENTFNIEINSSSNPEEIVEIIFERIQEERDSVTSNKRSGEE